MTPPRAASAVGLSLVAALLACGAEERPKAEPQPLVLPQPPTQNQAAQPSADELPVPEDFEAEAEREITRANLRAELDSIERELNGKPKR
jgi:hypothetical protein